jgi:hypothetical protein
LPAKEEENHCPKTDFRKAFDTVQWDNLLYILETRGFDHKWIGWLKMLMGTAKTAILLNGTPGPWIQIKRGLRQGDSLSPLLFIILVDVLQQVIKRFSIEKKLPGAQLSGHSVRGRHLDSNPRQTRPGSYP